MPENLEQVKKPQTSATFEQVKAIIKEKLGVNEEKITEKAAFVNDLGADSLDVVEFVMEVESRFGITIPDEDAGKLATVGDAVRYIDLHQPKTAKAAPKPAQAA